MPAISHRHHKTPETEQTAGMGKAKGGKRQRERMMMDLRKGKREKGRVRLDSSADRVE